MSAPPIPPTHLSSLLFPPIANSTPPDITGAHNSKTGIFIIYDIFGFFPQTLQGTDLLSAGTNSLVVVPDIFNGSPMPITNFPANTPEKKKALHSFFAGPAHPSTTVTKIRDTIFPVVKSRFPGIEVWAVLGYCWGAKVAALLSAAGTQFSACVMCHPAMMDPGDAGKIEVPVLVIATRDEEEGVVRRWGDGIPGGLREKSEVVRWEGTFHGFMAARANLKDGENYRFYEKG